MCEVRKSIRKTGLVPPKKSIFNGVDIVRPTMVVPASCSSGAAITRARSLNRKQMSDSILRRGKVDEDHYSDVGDIDE